jgi:transcriptional regulator with GAF, ATPase, and Fis domain
MRPIGLGEIVDLRVVRCIAGVVQRRWALGVVLGGSDGSLRCARGEPAPACPCLVEGCPLASSGCRPALAALEPDADGCFAWSCPLGLQQLGVPLAIDGERLGFVAAGGFLHGFGLPAAPSAARGPESAAELGEGAAFASRLPRLDAPDVALLRELLVTLAEEVVLYQTEVGAERRRAVGGAVPTRRTRYAYDEIIGESRPIVELYQLLDKVIDSDSTVLIQGENGTGKELIAKAIHFNSRRCQHRFVVQNCSAFNDNLLDSELFGHKKGAFTGAISDKQGLFEVADGSTFFLDEIGDMSPSLQVKLLRVLQEGTFIPVGDTQVRQVDVRIIAATNRDLRRMVERGEFREDLYYRINVIAVHVPALRERRDDIPLLVDHFLEKHARDRQRANKLSRECFAHLMHYGWPGNIRELENEIERMVVLAGDERVISEELLSARIRKPARAGDETIAVEPGCLPDAVEQLERSMIYEVLKRNHWNKTRAAEELRISRRNLIRKVNKYQLDQRRAP